MAKNQTPPPAKSSSNQQTILMALLILFVAVVIVGGLYLWTKSNATTTATNTNTVNTNTAQAITNINKINANKNINSSVIANTNQNTNQLANVNNIVNSNNTKTTYVYNGFQFQLPTSWLKTDEENFDMGIFGIQTRVTFNNNTQIISVITPMPTTGWESLTTTEETRTFTKNDKTYKAKIIFGTPKEGPDGEGASPAVIMLVSDYPESDNSWDSESSLWISTMVDWTDSKDIYRQIFNSIQ